MPIGHQGAPAGYLYLLDKEAGREFTGEDEEVMALFAPQAGAAIANAREYQAGIQSKADLGALIDTSPVGVVVFDARSGQVVSYNQEIRRIVKDLDMRDRSIMELLDVVTVRRTNGRRLEPACSGCGRISSASSRWSATCCPTPRDTRRNRPP
ncbi:MAG: GAF domain-containing protein [Gemmatimonadetes bacterium]|nr:GAF domain-containing protein [Gemmatimonadota bacterium]